MLFGTLGGPLLPIMSALSRRWTFITQSVSPKRMKNYPSLHLIPQCRQHNTMSAMHRRLRCISLLPGAPSSIRGPQQTKHSGNPPPPNPPNPPPRGPFFPKSLKNAFEPPPPRGRGGVSATLCNSPRRTLLNRLTGPELGHTRLAHSSGPSFKSGRWHAIPTPTTDVFRRERRENGMRFVP